MEYLALAMIYIPSLKKCLLVLFILIMLIMFWIFAILSIIGYWFLQLGSFILASLNFTLKRI